MTEDQIKYMVDRFLAWRLPDDFLPDGGISFSEPRRSAPGWPIGTNLLTAIQAEAMIRHMLEDMPAADR
jgi:hypothetical protein